MVQLERFLTSLPPELAAAVDALAQAERRSKSQMIRVLLEEALAARAGA